MLLSKKTLFLDMFFHRLTFEIFFLLFGDHLVSTAWIYFLWLSSEEHFLFEHISKAIVLEKPIFFSSNPPFPDYIVNGRANFTRKSVYGENIKGMLVSTEFTKVDPTTFRNRGTPPFS